MRLSWNEIRARAAQFSEEWKDERYERAETQSFYNDLFEVFGVKRRRVASFEEPVKGLGDKRGFIDLFWKGVLLVEHKSAGRSLIPAKAQALSYFPGLKDADLPRFIFLSDFQNFELYDLDEGTELKIKLRDFHSHVEAFSFILGVQKRTFRDQDPVNIEASELMGRLHDSLKASGYVGHDLERLLVRLLFCLFADDTGIFDQRDIFDDLIRSRTAVDGSDLGSWLHTLFEVLNTPTEKRQEKLDDDLKQFPYVNGDLFAERLPTPAFDAGMRMRLLEACDFSWDAISPAIFGSLFQSVMKPKERRALGAHYTTEKNILKVIEPLFMDGLKADFSHLSARRDTGRNNALTAFHDRLSALKFLDPACGCGNFLIIAYRELRILETEVLKALNPKGQRTLLDVATLSKVDVNQFYGIEIGEFPARIAEVALWLMDHIMNNRLSLEFGKSFARIPLKATPHIVHVDALETAWQSVLPSSECSYILGNPPFIGAKYQTDEQREKVRQLVDAKGAGGTLDYVSSWFVKAAEYAEGKNIPIGFVSTNSITQGEQVAQLWPLLLDRRGLEIFFAHKTFPWGSDARGVAHVHVIIVGLMQAKSAPKSRMLYSYNHKNAEPNESLHSAISPYLFDAGRLTNPHLVVVGKSKHAGGISSLSNGSIAADGGNLVFGDDRRAEILSREPGLADLIRPFVGGDDFLSNKQRFCLWLVDCPVERIKHSSVLKEVITAVRTMRLASLKAATRERAGTSSLFTERRQPLSGEYLAIPRTSSERRDYIPVGFVSHEVIAANDLQIVPYASLNDFGLIHSAMHNAWARVTSGRLKSDIRYSAKFTYNTFPLPPSDAMQKNELAPLATAILNARLEHASASLSDLYDPDLMPPNLRQAHRNLDKAVDKLYQRTPFVSDRDRVERLFEVYEQVATPLALSAKATRAKPGRKTKSAAE